MDGHKSIRNRSRLLCHSHGCIDRNYSQLIEMTIAMADGASGENRASWSAFGVDANRLFEDSSGLFVNRCNDRRSRSAK
jgi:hypothetical protein